MRESQEKNKDQVKNMRQTQKTKPHVVQREKIRSSGKRRPILKGNTENTLFWM